MSPQFLVTDINKSILLYTTHLGFQVGFRYEDFYAGLIKDQYSIHIKLADTVIIEKENRNNEEQLHLIFSVEGLEKLYEDFRKRSIKITQPLREMPYGKEFYIADPDGYVIAFIEGS